MAKEALSASQLEKLGDRLKAGPLVLDDLRQLRRFLETLEPFAEETFAKIDDLNSKDTGLCPAQITRRNVKTTRSIVAKLQRQTTTLAQIQDLVGCRIIVPDIIDQSQWLSALQELFPAVQVADRRSKPRYGYRAVHVIVRKSSQRFEIQLRTEFQDRWANIVEKIDDRYRLALKYGTGDPGIIQRMREAAQSFAQFEEFQQDFEARPDGAQEPFAKIVVCTYVADYQKAFDQIYLAEKEAWEAARPFKQPARPEATRTAKGLIRAKDVRGDSFEGSKSSGLAFKKADEHASRFLRLVLWSSVELPVGLELTICQAKVRQRVSVLGERPMAADRIVTPAFGDLQRGRWYEITQPARTDGYFLLDYELGDMIGDAEVPLRNLEALLE